MKRFLPSSFCLVGLAVLAVAFSGTARAGDSPPPNIVIILSDDLGYGSVGCYGADPKLVRTPNIDRLAREGVRFTDANTPSSVCTPTRYALMTGRYCWRTSLKHEVLGITAPLHIETDRLTVPSLLQKRGYRCAAVGKWHLGYGTAAVCDYTAELSPGPLDLGFEYHFSVPSNHGDNTGIYVENRQAFELRSKQLKPFGRSFYGGQFMGIDAPQRTNNLVMPMLTGKAVAWLDQQQAGTPFFLYFTPVAVHQPITPSPATAGTSKAGPYGDFIHELDASAGAILNALDRKGFTTNTLVIFTSDNGGVVPPPSQTNLNEYAAVKAGLAICGPWRGRKHSVYQGGFRVPFLARWPGKIPAGSSSAETISLADILATTAAIVGEKLPPPAQAAGDSYNVLPALLSQKLGRPIRDAIVVHSADGNFAIRQGAWKWIEGKFHPDTKPAALKLRADEFTPQLYNLADDPGEKNNVLDQHLDVARRLAALLDQYRDQGFSRP